MKRSLVDVNVWFALTVEEHPHHRAAKAWWDEEAAVIGFVRIAQLGLLRLLTSAEAMGGQPLTNEKAWEVYDALAADDRVRVLPELPAADPHFRRLSALRQSAPKLWIDAHLAALAITNEATLVTFDQAFSSYGIECRILGAPQ